MLKEKRSFSGKDVKERMIDQMSPAVPGGMGISQMSMPGAGRALLKQMLKEKDVVSADELLSIARESGVRRVACSMTMQAVGSKEMSWRRGSRSQERPVTSWMPAGPVALRSSDPPVGPE